MPYFLQIHFFFHFYTVLPASKDDLLLLNKHKNEKNKDTVLRVDGMPWTSSETDIEAFFEGMEDFEGNVREALQIYEISNFRDKHRQNSSGI